MRGAACSPDTFQHPDVEDEAIAQPLRAQVQRVVVLGDDKLFPVRFHMQGEVSLCSRLEGHSQFPRHLREITRLRVQGHDVVERQPAVHARSSRCRQASALAQHEAHEQPQQGQQGEDPEDLFSLFIDYIVKNRLLVKNRLFS